MEKRGRKSSPAGNENKEKKTTKGGSALRAASLGRGATAQVMRHSDSGLASTGTNISYEGATAPGSGGSVGTGYASGKQAVDEQLATNSDFDQNRATAPSTNKRTTRSGEKDNDRKDKQRPK